MTKKQCHQLLKEGLIGRIGCQVEGKVYIVPVTYSFEQDYIYTRSKEGLKIQMMRLNQEVCFQIDQIENMTNWRSVIAWGQFQEITNVFQQEEALKILADRLDVFQISESVKPGHAGNDVIHKERKPVLYRIAITELSGRFEKPND